MISKTRFLRFKMDTELIICGGCKESCEDPRVLVCGFYCDVCLDKLFITLDTTSNEFKCVYCEDSHKIPTNGFKRYSSMANVKAKRRKVCLDEVNNSQFAEELNINLKEIKSKLDKIDHKLNNPSDIIKEHCLNEKNKIDLRVEELIEQINNQRDGLFKKIDDYEKECIESLSKNKDKSEIVQGFLTETRKFHEKWNNYLSNFKMSEDEISNATKMVKCLQNKIPIFNKKLDSFVFNQSILNFSCKEEFLNEKTIGIVEQSLVSKISTDKLFKKDYNKWDINITNIEYFSSDKIVVTWEDSDNDFLLGTCDLRLSTIKKSSFFQNNLLLDFKLVSKEKHFRTCLFGQFVIFNYYDPSNEYLVKFDKDLNELKRIILKDETIDMKSNQRHIFLLTSAANCNIHVLNEDLLFIHKYGQTEIPECPFYFSSEIKRFLVYNKMFMYLHIHI